MVDFSKKLSKPKIDKPIDPVSIYDGLDRASDKGELRRAQLHVVKEWASKHREERDVIVKLHTGQGKTVIGLVLLQAKLNEKGGNGVYFCPTVQLIDQTYDQAKQFGFNVCRAVSGEPLPASFLDGTAILITSVQKLFNGRTLFKLHHNSIPLTAFVMDDSHACVDAIRDAISLRIPRELFDSKGKSKGMHPVFEKLWGLFTDALRDQGEGTFQEIEAKTPNAILAVPYWAWKERVSEVTRAVSESDNDDHVKFVWPILKDRMAECICVFSGTGLEIIPYLAPLEDFGSYWKAGTRIFMSATVTDDSFLVKGLRLKETTILHPITYPLETWSGEKMVLIPSLIDDSLDRSTMVKEFGVSNAKRTVGVAALSPSFKSTADWKAYGAIIADKETIADALTLLKNGPRISTVVFVNRYDGIDLPDEACRMLIFDGLPYGESIVDQYVQACRGDSEMSLLRIARSIEQGMGRSVRGEKDFSVVVMIGPDLVNFVRQTATRAYLSDQTKHQIEIGLEIASAAQEEIKVGTDPIAGFRDLANQCIRRDAGWKAFYIDRMNQIKAEHVKPRGLSIFQKELEAETEYQVGNVDRAIKILQGLVDIGPMSDAEKGFYLQEMARYQLKSSKPKSNDLQKAAHKKNRFLFKPLQGFEIEQLNPLAGKRAASIASWMGEFESFESLKLSVEGILSNLGFGVKAENFERSLQKLGEMLGYSSELPDRQWKAGPDNLWCLKRGDYLLFECKSEVLVDRAEIRKEETGQMNNSSAWFASNYKEASVTRLLIVPTFKLGPGAAFTDPVAVMRKHELSKLVSSVRAFVQEFASVDLNDIDEGKIQEFLVAHKLTTEHLKTEYQKPVYSGSAGRI